LLFLQDVQHCSSAAAVAVELEKKIANTSLQEKAAGAGSLSGRVRETSSAFG
jgi:hypothetical protein